MSGHGSEDRLATRIPGGLRLVIDFQSIHAQQLEVYQKYAAWKRRSLEPIRQANDKAARVKRLNTISGQLVRGKKPFLPKEVLCRRVDLLVYQFKPLPRVKGLYI